MTKHRDFLILFGTFLVASCDSPASNGMDGDSDDSNTEDGETQSEDEGDDSPDEQECHEALPKGSVPLGGPCATNVECETHVCETFETVTAPGEGVCAATPPECRTRIMGTVRDVRSGLPIGDAAVALLPAAEAAGGIQFARHLIDEVSDPDGHFDTVTDEPIDAFVAVIGLVEAMDRVATVTGLSSPIDEHRNYEACFAFRDWWTVSEADLAVWNESLANDSEAVPFLPLDEEWDVVGFVRSITHPPSLVTGAKLSLSDSSSATIIRYLNEDGATFNDEATTSAGLFVIVGASPGELFKIDVPGMTPFAADGIRTGVFPDALYTLPVWMVPD